MSINAERALAWGLLIICLILALAGFSFSDRASPPEKIWFDATGGDVIFDHAYHASFTNCRECHHNLEKKDLPEAEMKCRDCHYYGEARGLESSDPTHKRFIGLNCIRCHRGMEMETDCNSCHIRKGFAFEESGRDREPVPEKATFETDNGRVVFNHELHISEDFGFTCKACHHEFKGGEELKHMKGEKSCRACHYELADKIPLYFDSNYHMRYIGANCAYCHDEEDCSRCHEY